MKHNKSALLTIIKEALASDEISCNDLNKVIAAQQKTTHTHSGINKFFYYLGGIILLIGLIILLTNYWVALSSTTRVFIANGSLLLSYFIAIIFAENKRFTLVATPFFLICAALIPIALMINFHEIASVAVTADFKIALAFSCAACLWAFLCYRRTELLAFVILYTSFLYLSWLTDWNTFATIIFPTKYLCGTLLLGMIYAGLLSRVFMRRQILAKSLLYIGIIIILCSLLLLRRPGMQMYLLWDVLLIIALLFNFTLAIYLKDIFLKLIGWIIFIIYTIIITSDYFAHSIGWVLSLMIAGLTIIIGSFLLRRLRIE